MAKSQTIRCIVKGDRDSPYEAIESVGGTNPNGTRWTQSQQWAVQGIDSGEWELHSEGVDRVRVRVVTATSRYGHRYIRTEADHDLPDNLLKLPKCP